MKVAFDATRIRTRNLKASPIIIQGGIMGSPWAGHGLILSKLVRATRMICIRA